VRMNGRCRGRSGRLLARKHEQLAVIHVFHPTTAQKDELIKFIHLFHVPDAQIHEYFSVIHGLAKHYA